MNSNPTWAWIRVIRVDSNLTQTRIFQTHTWKFGSGSGRWVGWFLPGLLASASFSLFFSSLPPKPQIVNQIRSRPFADSGIWFPYTFLLATDCFLFPSPPMGMTFSGLGGRSRVWLAVGVTIHVPWSCFTETMHLLHKNQFVCNKVGWPRWGPIFL